MDSETYQQDSQYEIHAVSMIINEVVTRLHFFLEEAVRFQSAIRFRREKVREHLYPL